MAKKKKSEPQNIIARNRKAGFRYFIEDKIEAGIALEGWEVKSLRQGKAQISESYVITKNNELWLIGAVIQPLNSASTHIQTIELRTRKLLLHRKQIDKLIGQVQQKQYTIVATEMYWKKSIVKISIALARGKKSHDKRSAIKERDLNREANKAMRARQLLS